jgi:hypothetical protein
MGVYPGKERLFHVFEKKCAWLLPVHMVVGFAVGGLWGTAGGYAGRVVCDGYGYDTANGRGDGYG